MGLFLGHGSNRPCNPAPFRGAFMVGAGAMLCKTRGGEFGALLLDEDFDRHSRTLSSFT